MLESFVISPADREELTKRISFRSWERPQVGIVLGTLFLLYFLASSIGLFFGEEHMPLVRLVTTLLIYAVVTALIALIIRRRGGSWADHYGMGLQQLKKLALSPVLYLATIPFLILATKSWHVLLQKVFGLEIELQEVAQLLSQESSWLKILYILMAVLVAPLFEEIVFRGMLFPYLVKRGGLAGGTVLVSLLFAMMHLHLPSFLPIFLISAVLCLAYWRTGSLWVGIGMHAIFNAVNILALNLAG